METGIIKKWNDQQGWGIVYCPGERKFFIHAKNVVQGNPRLYARVTFDIGTPRNPRELTPAINIVVGELVAPVSFGTKAVS